MSKKQKQSIALRDAHITIAKLEIDKAIELVKNAVDEENKPKFVAFQKTLEKHSTEIDTLSNEILSNLNPEEPEQYVSEMEKNSNIQVSFLKQFLKLFFLSKNMINMIEQKPIHIIRLHLLHHQLLQESRQ